MRPLDLGKGQAGLLEMPPQTSARARRTRPALIPAASSCSGPQVGLHRPCKPARQRHIFPSHERQEATRARRCARPAAGQTAIRARARSTPSSARRGRLAPSATGSGRLILSLDATMSRQPTWDLACALQGEMFDAVGKAGALSVQLVYFRGLGECRASKFVTRHRCA